MNVLSSAVLPLIRSFASAILCCITVLLVALATFAVYRLHFHALAGIPGPRLAAVTSCWLARHVKDGNTARLSPELHRRYGSAVRVRPDEVWFNSKYAFDTIYNPTSGFAKSDFYLSTSLLKPKLAWNLQLQSADTLDLLAERDMKRYRLQRRLIGPIYNPTNVKRYEAAIDAVLSKAIEELRQLNGIEVDLNEWMHIIVVECLGSLTLSWSPGFIKNRTDNLSGRHAYLGWRRKSLFGLFPAAVTLESMSKSFGRLFAIVWRVTYTIPKGQFKPFFPPVQKKVSRRVDAAVRRNSTNDDRSDMMAALIELHKARPAFSEKYLRRMAMTNFGAGHETTTSALVSVFAMLGCHQKSQVLARSEFTGQSSLSYDEATRLRYVQACIKEAQRLYPVIGMSLPRTVPSGGTHINGHQLPAGTVVGCNPFALHRNSAIFGSDAERYDPERWLDPVMRPTLDKYSLTYGGGARTCPGRYLAEMMVSKIVVALIQHFHIRVTMPPDEEMKCYFMAMMTNVKASFSPINQE